MKQLSTRLMRVLLTLLCITRLMVAASAFDSDAFREKNSDALEARGISLYGMHEFREGLMPVLVNDQWNYINEQLQLVDLNKNRFTYDEEIVCNFVFSIPVHGTFYWYSISFHRYRT